MKSNVLEDFFDFELHFNEFINRTTYFKKVSKAVFFVFDDAFKSINYLHRYNSEEDITMEDIKAYQTNATLVLSDIYCEVKIYEAKEKGDHFNRFMINIFNPVSNNHDLLGCLMICLQEKYDEKDFQNLFNLHYFSQLVFHVQMVISNYEKLYYIIDMFSELMASRDLYMPYHMTNVANRCVQLSSMLNLTYKEQQLLYFSALLHDIGKLFVPESIINKQGRLDAKEFLRAKSHSVKGDEIIRTTLYGMTLLDQIPEIIRHHHERYDGQGYPDGLKGEKIPYLSRIITVADSVDAMLSRRAYKDKETLDRVISELSSNSGTQFDPTIANMMIDILINEKSKINTNSQTGPLFIPKCSLSFIYVGDVIKSVTGNLLIDNQKGTFIVHDPDYRVYSVNSMTKATVCYFNDDEIREYRVNVTKIEKGRLYLDKISYLPTDKTFSMVWNGHVTMVDSETQESQLMEIINFGGDSIVLKINATEPWCQRITDNVNRNYKIHIDETIESISVQLTLGIRIIKFYASNSYTFICKYTDIKPGEKDKILRLLFRKQILLNQDKSKLAHK